MILFLKTYEKEVITIKLILDTITYFQIQHNELLKLYNF